MRHAFVVSVSLAFLVAPVQAYFMTGNSVVKDCNLTAPTASCVAYVTGMLDGMWWGEPNMNCLPQGVTSAQVAAVFAKYLADHPARLHLNAPVLLADAVSAAWQCPWMEYEGGTKTN